MLSERQVIEARAYAVGAQHAAPLYKHHVEFVQHLVGQLVNCAAACCTNLGSNHLASKLINNSLTSWQIVQQLVAQIHKELIWRH
jgi:hypothetical protein